MDYKINTKCILGGYAPENGEPRQVPIVQSTTFKYDSSIEMGKLFDLEASGYFYTRLQNPTNDAVAAKIASLEGGVGALATASGMSATMLAVLNLASAGDNFVSSSNIYGGTYNLFAVTLKRMGIECRFVENDAPAEEIESKIDENTKFIFVETIANPAGKIADFDKFSQISKKYGLVLMCDNTISTPYICRPFEYGVNVIVHASTKYLDGHATSVGGLIVDGGNFEYLGNPRYPLFNNPDIKT